MIPKSLVLKVSFYFEIIINNRKLEKNVQGDSHVSLTQFYLMVTSCVTIVQYQNQELTLALSTEHIHISSALHALFCAQCADLYSYYHSQELIYHQKGISH